MLLEMFLQILRIGSGWFQIKPASNNIYSPLKENKIKMEYRGLQRFYTSIQFFFIQKIILMTIAHILILRTIDLLRSLMIFLRFTFLWVRLNLLKLIADLKNYLQSAVNSCKECLANFNTAKKLLIFLEIRFWLKSA